MRLLSVETSCDETAIAILEATGLPAQAGDIQDARFKILGNALLSQVELHRPYGGVYPMLAKREHQKNLPHILEEALTQAKLAEDEVDAIAVTVGPGLEPALWTGIEFAKDLAQKWQKPLVAVNHMEGHILSALAEKSTDNSLQITGVHMPVLALLISGGHTELVVSDDLHTYKLLGQTVDDAVGEAFDKVARMLELPYPGGPEISKLAEVMRESNETHTIKLPRPMIDSKTCDFSFAGLKTAVLYLLKDKPETVKEHVALEFENAVADVLWKKTAMALEQTGAETLVLGGGVSANTHIRRVFKDKIESEYPHVALRIPTPDLTTDNAVMIGLAGYFRALRSEFADLDSLKANGNLSLSKK